MSFPRYPKYKDSGVEWLGQVPEHWDVMKTSRCFRISMGQSILTEDLEEDGDWPVFSATEEDHYFGHVRDPRVRLGVGDLVIPARGNSIGAVKLVKEPSTTTQTTIYCKNLTDGKLQGSFAFRFMQGCRENLFYFTQTAIPQITVQEVASNPLLLPPLPEQTAIASFLDRETAKIDALVAEQQRLIELLKEKRQAVISHAVTKGLNPDAPMKPSGIEWLGDVPAHWEESRMGNLFRAVGEPGNTDLPILSVSIHHGVSDKEMSDEELDRKVTRSEDRSKYVRVAPGDLVYNMMRAWQGGFGTVAVNGMVSPAYVVARPRKPMETNFIEHLLRTPQAIEQMRRHSHGVTDFRLRLYWGEFKNIEAILPPLHEARDICSHISEADAEFSDLSAVSQRAINLLQERRTALISAAVTGQIDVRSYELAIARSIG